MNRKKKWMVTLEDDQYKWVKETAEDVPVNGSIIIQELIEEKMKSKDKSKEFKESLLEAQGRARRQELEQKKAAIEAELEGLRKRAVSV